MRLLLSPREIDLSEHTSMGVGARASAFEPRTVEEFRDVLHALTCSGEYPFVLGGGYNTVFPDHPFTRPIILTSKLSQYTFQGTGLRAQAGARLDTIIGMSISAGLSGLEHFRGVPGTVGGAIAMNAGGSGHEFGDLVRNFTAVDPSTGEIVVLHRDEIRWGYRHARLNGLVVAEAELDLVPADTASLRKRAIAFIKKKAEQQPLSSHNAGCVFKNPPGSSAGAMIDLLGLKGERVGHAVVSSRHANFIINQAGAARTSDVLKLIERVRTVVRNHYGVQLELEVVLARDAAVDSRETA
jgi:UDP-N-acetylmuramate dehydrogenase